MSKVRQITCSHDCRFPRLNDVQYKHRLALELLLNCSTLCTNMKCCNLKRVLLCAGTIIVLFVTENLVSKMAFQMAKAFLRHEVDQLHIVTSVVGEQGLEKGNQLLESYQDPLVNNKIILKILTRGQAKVIDFQRLCR